MDAGAFVMAIAVLATIGIALYLMSSLVLSMRGSVRRGAKVWRNFGLSIAFCILFLTSWFLQGVVQWQQFTDDQSTHGEAVQVGDFVANFAQSTLENWQSEFLQLFSFVVLSALLIHKGKRRVQGQRRSNGASLESHRKTSVRNGVEGLMQVRRRRDGTRS